MIINVYSQNQQYNYKTNNLAQKNNNISYQTSLLNNKSTTGDSVSFHGLKNILEHILPTKENKNAFVHYVDRVSTILDQDEKDVKKLISGKSMKQLDFFDALVQRYNTFNMSKKNGEKEDSKIVNEIFTRIAEPTEEHKNFVTRTKFNVTDMNECFKLLGDDPKKIGSALEIYKSIGDWNNNKKITKDIISSPMQKEFLEHFEDYKPYLQNNMKNKDVVSSLEALCQDGVYNSNKENNRKIIHNCLYSLSAKDEQELTKRFLEHYSESGNSIITILTDMVSYGSKDIPSQADKDALVKIYQTTTPKNKDIRRKYIASYGRRIDRDALKDDEYTNLATLFERMDKNPKEMKFITNLISKGVDIDCTEFYLKLMDDVNIDRLNDKVSLIAKESKRNLGMVKLTDYFRRKPNRETFKDRVMVNLKRIFSDDYKGETGWYDVLRMSRVEKPKELDIPRVNKALNIQPAIKPEPVAQPIPAPVSKEMNSAKGALTPDERRILNEHAGGMRIVQRLPIAPAVPALPSAPVGDVAPTVSIIPFVRPAQTVAPAQTTIPATTPTLRQHIKKEPNAKKLVVISDVNNIIKKKLSSAVYEDQANTYANKATKMRLNLLPEIFDSIKETRATERANGTFKKNKSVKNEDALALYRRINGKNRRLVNYMLKVRNQDGTRKYNIREIVDVLNEANRHIMDMKEVAPKGTRITAKDEKEIYAGLLAHEIEKYGKLPIAKSKSKKS
jgi:predicted small metal-binding protein